jgi:hypothetical protein
VDKPRGIRTLLRGAQYGLGRSTGFASADDAIDGRRGYRRHCGGLSNVDFDDFQNSRLGRSRPGVT